MNTGISEQMLHEYCRNGIIKVEQVISREEAARFREVTLQLLESAPKGGPVTYAEAFHQYVDVWRDNDLLQLLTLHPKVGAIAEQLAGIPMRLWHDHTLAKAPSKAQPTAFHQDQIKWPFAKPRHTLSAWIALQDTPVERGCMSFIAGSHEVEDLPNIGTGDQERWKVEKPDLEWWPRLTVPLKAGDCTFHNGMIMHAAGANLTEEWRVAHVVILVDREAVYSGQKHVVTDSFGLEAGRRMPDDRFPPVEKYGVNG